MISTL